MENKTISEMSVETRLICQRLERLEIGEMVTYSELSKEIGRDIQRGGRHVLESARRIIQRGKQILLECVREVGLKRLDDAGIIGSTNVSIIKVNNTARRGMSKASCLKNIDALPQYEKNQLNANISILALLAYATESESVKKIENRVSKTQERLPLMKTIKAFMD